MKPLHYSDSTYFYVVLLTQDSDSFDWTVRAVWRFHHGRITGEQVSLSVLPWRARVDVAELTNDPIP